MWNLLKRLTSPNKTAPKPPEEAVGLVIKRHYEGCEKRLSNGLIAPYLCPRGIPTIGWGNTFWEDGRRVSMSDSAITQERADKLGAWAWNDFKRRVRALLPPGSPDRDVEVFTSLAYNIGINAFADSVTLKRYKDGNREEAGQAIENWARSGGVIFKGLQRRRRAEHYVFDGTPVKAAIQQATKDYP